MRLSDRSQVPPFAVMEVLAAANARRDTGADVLNLCAGQPFHGASALVRERAVEVLRGGDVGYTETAGVPALRRAIAAHYGRWYGADVDPARVVVTTGSSGAFVLAFLTLFDPGDRVALARPGYPAYANVLRALGCEVVELACDATTRYQPTVDHLEAASAGGPLAGLVLASPANPTGTMVDAEGVAALAAWCAANGARLISDEIYHGLTYGGVGRGATAVDHGATGAVVVSSFSKYWAMTGWRLGWAVLPPGESAVVDALAGNVALCPPGLAQHAALAALSEEGYAAAEADVAVYARSRELLLARLPELGWTVAPPDGAFYLWVDVFASGLDSVTWCRRLLEEADVAMTPGTDFDRVDGARWARLSFAAPPEVVGTAVDRIAAWQQRA